MNVQVATQQPPTTAKLLLYTSHGEIDIELWAKETPLASKNFIQHCLSGYYLNTLFHRLIPGFMIQGGDPTATGMGGQSIYGGPFKDQFHQRLKFSRRGIVAMANAGKNTNKSQFFITFGPCQHLNKKHTIFGKVVGDTIYNLMALQSLDTGEQDRPLDPPVIRKIKVIEHPFTDIKVQSIPQIQKDGILNKQKPGKQNSINKQQLQKEKKEDIKKLKNKKKLTFEDEQQIGEAAVPKLISSHDVLYKKDASLSNKVSITKQEIEKKRRQKQIEQKKAEQLKHSLTLNLKQQEKQQQNPQQQSVNRMIEKQMHKKRTHFEKTAVQGLTQQKDEVLDYIKRYNPNTKKYEIVFRDQIDREKAEQQRQQELERKAKEQQEITDQKLKQVREMQMQEYKLLKADELNFKKAKEGSLKERRKEIIEEEKKLLSNLEKHRYEFMKKQKMQEHEGELFKKLMDFSSRLKTVKVVTSNKDGQDQNQTQQKSAVNLKNGWMNHKLKFHIDSTNAYSLQQKAMRVNKNYQEEDDGGLKMQIEQNNSEDDDEKEIYEKVLKEL